MSEEVTTPTPASQDEHNCGNPECKGECMNTTSGSSDAEVSQEYEAASLAVLLALVPLLVFTFFGQVGLF